tara:strand:- start:2047 stop:2853 length:807 start_codon:yes stop_codon:yes gene_type:complete
MTMLGVLLISLVGGTVYDKAPADVDAYLQALTTTEPTFVERFTHVVKDAVGTPYADGPLGEGPQGTYDTDPLMDLSRVDCVTFVEQSVALATAGDTHEAEAKLQLLRYADGQIDFATRNHFMLVDWIPNNPWCLDTTATLGVPTAKVTRTISKSAFFKLVKAPTLGQDIPDRDVTITYVPSANVAAAEARLREPTLVVFLGTVDWLFSLHCGIYLPDGNGGGALYHASSKAGNVSVTDLSDYVAGQGKRYIGITTYTITSPLTTSAAG